MAIFARSSLLLHIFLLLASTSLPLAMVKAQTFTTLTCPYVNRTSDTTRLAGRDPVRSFTEVSGLAFSDQLYKANNPLLYAITDGKNNNTGRDEAGYIGGRIGVFKSSSGSRLVSLTLPHPGILHGNTDWESLTYGSCGTLTEADFTEMHSGKCLYVGDVGDNVAKNTKGRRSDRFKGRKGVYDPYRIIKIKEPNYSQYDVDNIDTIVIPEEDVFILPFDYYHDTSPVDYSDSETIFLDHVGWGNPQNHSVGDIYIVTKWDGSRILQTRLYQIPASAWSGHNTTYENLVGGQGITIHPTVSPPTNAVFDASDKFFQIQWTGGDMRRDGHVIALNTLTNTSLFLRCEGESVDDAIVAANNIRSSSTSTSTSTIGNQRICTTFLNPADGQSESTAFTPGESRMVQIPEGRRPRMGWAMLIPDHPNAVRRTCPAYNPDDTNNMVVVEAVEAPEATQNATSTTIAPTDDAVLVDFNATEMERIEAEPTPADDYDDVDSAVSVSVSINNNKRRRLGAP